MPPEIGMVAPSTTEAVQHVEALGVDSLWVGGHLASPHPSPEPTVWLARLVEQARRAAVGTATLVLPWYAPAIVEADTKAGAEAGVNGTPAFFVNGILVSGAQPYEKFKEVIDRELQR